MKKVNKYYPDTEETPKGHTQQGHQGVISTKERVTMASDKNEKIQRRKQHGIYVTVDQVKDTIYTDKTGNSPIK